MEFPELHCEQETALEFLLRLGADGLFINSNLQTLNPVLSLSPGRVYEIDGDIGAGKTQICYSIAAKFLKFKKTAKIAWISAIPLRIDHITKHFEDSHNLVDRIWKKVPEKIAEFIKELNWILENWKNEKIQLLIVENIDAILHDTVYQGMEKGRHVQFEVVERFNKLARDGVTVVITNHVTRWRGYPAPALGEFWSTNVKNRFYVEKLETGENIRVISTIKAGSTTTTEARFRIGDNGLEEV